jgi:uncharacterized protein YutE (UPF0331/DUF86 family)
MTDGGSKREFLRNAVSELEDEGYEVFLQPKQPPVLPPFLKGFHPDIIAHRDDEHLVVQIVTRPGETNTDIGAMTSAIRAQPGWNMRLIVATPTRIQTTLPQQSNEAIKQSADDMAALIRDGHHRAALLMGWSTFEALGRAAMPKEFARPQTPGRLVAVLAQEGYVTPGEADLLRKLAGKRSALIHGEVQTDVSKAEVEEFAAILGTLMELQATAA